jgi:hypothetical protein
VTRKKVNMELSEEIPSRREMMALAGTLAAGGLFLWPDSTAAQGQPALARIVTVQGDAFEAALVNCGLDRGASARVASHGGAAPHRLRRGNLADRYLPAARIAAGISAVSARISLSQATETAQGTNTRISLASGTCDFAALVYPQALASLSGETKRRIFGGTIRETAEFQQHAAASGSSCTN